MAEGLRQLHLLGETDVLIVKEDDAMFQERVMNVALLLRAQRSGQVDIADLRANVRR